MSSSLVSRGLPCPKCSSSDAYAIYSDGHGHCFSCNAHVPSEDSLGGTVVTLEPYVSDLLLGGTHEGVPTRKLSKETCEFFDVKTTPSGDLVFPYYSDGAELVAQKVRSTARPKGAWRGAKDKARALFGSQKFSSGNSITIVEGEPDALAYRDLMGDYPVVSISSGAQGAAKDVRENLEYFNKFQKIVVCFDSDDPGRKAAQEVAQIFPIGKVKICHLRHFKDANEYLINNAYSEFKKCWWDAEPYSPAGIEAAHKGGFDSLFEEVDHLELFPYPFDGLNEKTFGIRKGEMVTIVSGSGNGKSSFVGETAYKWLMETDRKIGMLMLEESPKKTKMRFMSLFLSKPLHLTLLGKLAKKFPFLEKVLHNLFHNPADYDFDEEAKKDLKRAWEATIEKKTKGGDTQLWLYNHFGSADIDTICARVDALASGIGCELIILDHVSIVVSSQEAGDERKALDAIATRLRTIVEQRNIALLLVSHLRRPNGTPHEEGATTSLADIRGTAGIGQLSDIVIGLERNGQAENPYVANVVTFRVLKNRFSGFLGVTAYGHYDSATGRLSEITEEDYKKALEENPFDEKPEETPE